MRPGPPRAEDPPSQPPAIRPVDRTPGPAATVHTVGVATPAPLRMGANTAIPTAPVRVTLAWAGSAGNSVDVSALLCGGDGRVLDPEAIVFYNQPVGAGGAVRAAAEHRPMVPT